MENTGGRNKLNTGVEYRIIELNGSISDEIYRINCEEEFAIADRKGLITLTNKAGRQIRVHSRRLIPVSASNKAIVITSGGKYVATCPTCCSSQEVSPNVSELVCVCGNTSNIEWLGERPMTEVATKTEKKLKTEKPSAEKKVKAVKELHIPDIEAIKALQNCQLWKKPNLKFSKVDVEVTSYCLLFSDGETSRKYCFNTYNGNTGKRGEVLYIENFLADSPIDGKKNKPWYAVKDIEKARAKLEKEQYDLA